MASTCGNKLIIILFFIDKTDRIKSNVNCVFVIKYFCTAAEIAAWNFSLKIRGLIINYLYIFELLDIIYFDICSPDEFIFLIVRAFNYVTDKVNCVQFMWLMIMNFHIASKDARRTNLNNVFRNIFGILSSFFKQCFYKPSYL